MEKERFDVVFSLVYGVERPGLSRGGGRQGCLAQSKGADGFWRAGFRGGAGDYFGDWRTWP